MCRLKGDGGVGPVLLWFGPRGKAPAKLGRATNKVYSEGHAELIVPPCDACTCGTLTHTCTLPTKMTAYDVWPCPAGQPGQPFDAASPWDGTCDDNYPIPGPNNVKSLLVDAIDLVEGCAPSPKVQTPGAVTWMTDAAAFENALTACGEEPTGLVCAPALSAPGDPPEGFHMCMMHEGIGDGLCFGEDYTEPHVFWRGVQEDTRACAPCTCTPPAVKGTCASALSVYQNADTSCNGPEANPGQGISSEMPTCIQMNPANQPLGSKSATAPQYTPAPGGPTCQPGGGEQQGSFIPAEWTTFCCIP